MKFRGQSLSIQLINFLLFELEHCTLHILHVAIELFLKFSAHCLNLLLCFEKLRQFTLLRCRAKKVITRVIQHSVGRNGKFIQSYSSEFSPCVPCSRASRHSAGISGISSRSFPQSCYNETEACLSWVPTFQPENTNRPPKATMKKVGTRVVSRVISSPWLDIISLSLCDRLWKIVVISVSATLIPFLKLYLKSPFLKHTCESICSTRFSSIFSTSRS